MCRHPFQTALFLLACAAACSTGDVPPTSHLANEHWDIRYDERGIRTLTSPRDPFRANVLPEPGMLDADVRFQLNGGEWQTVFKRFTEFYRPPEEEPSYARRHFVEGNRVRYTDYKPGMPFALEQTFTLNGERLEWDLVIENRMGYLVRVGDVVIDVPSRGATGSTQEGLFEGGFLRQHHVSGNSSFLLFIRRSGAPPYLLLTVKPGTGLEYVQGSQYFVRSGYSGNAETRGTWRQPHTYDRLGPAGAQDDRLEFGFELQWAESYDEVRRFLYRNGLVDLRVVPGMTVPEDLEARFSLHTAASIDSIIAEFPEETDIAYLGETVPHHHVYGVRFRRLGENLLTVHFGGDRKTYLEFFSSEPIETLLRKRSRFIVANQQHRDPRLWYDGLFSIWDMRNAVLRGPDNTDGYDGWYGYMVASDDPVLGIAPYLASVNALDPDPAQIRALEYHIQRFVWGGLQRTDQDDPYPYGIYGVPNWKVARDTLLRAQVENRRLDRMKIWRAYDYAHVFMLYFHMYQIAQRYPDLVTFRDGDGYLELAWQTARAFFEYPYEIYPWYDIYKWGFYNELLVPEIIHALEERGRRAEADSLRRQWEIKVRYFVHDDPYPYRSEYPTDRTAFESTFALARYGARTELAAADSLWYDQNVRTWRSYPALTREDALRLMERQHLAGLAVRGWIPTAYYQLGADGSLSYMARMGGWSILRYGLEFASEPHDWLQLGYASYLSSFALMNTGPPEANYGFWYPGPENDGALGWAFQTSKHGRPWIRQDESRGPWRYDGEANLGMGAVTRTAATILTEDPIFGWLAYGGILQRGTSGFQIHPRDGVRTRFWVVDGHRRLGLELERDGWSPQQPILVDLDLAGLRLVVQNRTGAEHVTRLFLEAWEGAEWRVSLDGEELQPQSLGHRQVYRLPVTRSQHELTVERR